ncbi:MAG: HI0074 family nucleotidyltransferase substrate-binding subunit [Clostridia bacterium]|nr:HI0074 family nucleotidyltransferase substrate-binding subunit [Clostridia bacterium]
MKKFENYRSNLAVLTHAHEQDLENEFIISGIIDKFFLQLELGWKSLKELLAYEGADIARSGSPREIIKAAYQLFDSMDEDTWLTMLSQRNNMAHIYDEAEAKALTQAILDKYIPAFQALEQEILDRYGEILNTL